MEREGEASTEQSQVRERTRGRVISFLHSGAKEPPNVPDGPHCQQLHGAQRERRSSWLQQKQCIYC